MYSWRIFRPAPYQAPVAVIAVTDAVITYRRIFWNDGDDILFLRVEEN